MFQQLDINEKLWIMEENKKLFVGHTYLKYFSGQLGNDQVATFIGQSYGGSTIRSRLVMKLLKLLNANKVSSTT